MVNNQDKWQEECIEQWRVNKGIGLVEAVTGSGKTILALKIIKKLQESSLFDLKTVMVVVHRANMKQQWTKEIKDYLGDDTCNIIVETIHIAHKNKYDVDFIIYDEIHEYLGEKWFNVFNNVKYKFLLGLSGTLLQTDKFKKLYKKYKIVYSYPIEKGIEDNSISNLIVYNLAIPVTNDENNQFKSWKTQIRQYLEYFDNDYIKMMKCLPKKKGDTSYLIHLRNMSRETGIDESTLLGKAKSCNKLVQERMDYLNTHHSKINTCINIINHFDKKMMVFAPTIDVAEIIGSNTNTPVLHSKLPDDLIQDNFNLFKENKVKCLNSVDMLKTGTNITDVNLGIIISCNSSPVTMEQIGGRIIRKHKDKDKGILVCLYCDSPYSQDKQWLMKAQTRLSKRINGNIKWINTLTEII